MYLPNNFQFTQTNLQDFIDCPKRFELKYLQQIHWPARIVDNAQEYQEWMELGSRFHFLLYQFFSGLQADDLGKSIDDPSLASWWHAFLTWIEQERLNGDFFPEYTLFAEVAGHRVAAKYDLIVRDGNKVMIVDWKTSKKPTNAFLNDRIQSRVYPLIMTLAGKVIQISHKPVIPEMIEMLYWFANKPNDPFITQYDENLYNQDHALISRLIQKITSLSKDEYRKTEDVRHCRFCSYRAYCNRGAEPGKIEEFDALETEQEMDVLLQDFEHRLDQIGEAWL